MDRRGPPIRPFRAFHYPECARDPTASYAQGIPASLWHVPLRHLCHVPSRGPRSVSAIYLIPADRRLLLTNHGQPSHHRPSDTPIPPAFRHDARIQHHRSARRRCRVYPCAMCSDVPDLSTTNDEYRETAHLCGCLMSCRPTGTLYGAGGWILCWHV